MTSCDPDQMPTLSAEGGAVAQIIGQTIQGMEIPIGRVFSSEYCRTRETVQYMGLGPVTATPAIMNMRAVEFLGGQDAAIYRARGALSTPPRAVTNSVFVAHGNLLLAVSGAYTGEAEAAIFLPHGNGEFQMVAQLAPQDWELFGRKFAMDEE